MISLILKGLETILMMGTRSDKSMGIWVYMCTRIETIRDKHSHHLIGTS